MIAFVEIACVMKSIEWESQKKNWARDKTGNNLSEKSKSEMAIKNRIQLPVIKHCTRNCY